MTVGFIGADEAYHLDGAASDPSLASVSGFMRWSIEAAEGVAATARELGQSDVTSSCTFAKVS